MNATTAKLELSEVWEALVAAGETIYEWCEQGVATGCQVILIGDSVAITLSDSEGYQIEKVADCDYSWELVAQDEYDNTAAIKSASDLSGYFGIVGVPGSNHHDFEWFGTRDQAEEWADRRYAEEIATVGSVECRVLTGEEAFGDTLLDGTHVYFRARDFGMAGFMPK
jgi:hypothetical protein